MQENIKLTIVGACIALGIIGMLGGVFYLTWLSTEEKTEDEIYQLGIDTGISRTVSPCQFKQMVNDGVYDWEISEQMKGILSVVEDCT